MTIELNEGFDTLRGPGGPILIDPKGEVDASHRAVVLSAAHPLAFRRDALEKAVRGRVLVVPESVRAHLPTSLAASASELVVVPPDASVPLGELTLHGVGPASSGGEDSLAIASADDVVWLSACAGVTAPRALALRERTGTRRIRACVGLDLGVPLRLATGGARGFPYEDYAALLEATADAARLASLSLLVVTPDPAAAWLRPRSSPVSAQRFRDDVRAYLGSDIEVVGATGPRDRFDPTQSVPPLRAHGACPPDILARMTSGAQSIESAYPDCVSALHGWKVAFVLRILSDSAEHVVAIDWSQPERVVRHAKPQEASIQASVTASGLSDLLDDRASAYELALRGDLRVAERLFQTSGTSVRRPLWFTRWQPLEGGARNHTDGFRPLPAPIDLLDAVRAAHVRVPRPGGLEG